MYYISSFVSVSFQRLCWCPSAHLSNHFPEYRKIPKISPRAYIFQGPFWGAYFWSGLHTEGNLRFKISCAILIVARKFTVFALFYFAPSSSPKGAYIWRGDLTFVFFALRVWGGLYLEGLIPGGACFRNFTVYRVWKMASTWIEARALYTCLLSFPGFWT